MFQNLLKNTKFRDKISKFHIKNQDKIIDIILFGSAIRGKEDPQDIDLLLWLKEKDKKREIEYSLRKLIEELNIKPQIIPITYDILTSPSFQPREDILSQGYSLVYEKYVSEGFGYKNFILWKYELKGFNQSQRMRFQYSLYGRKREGGMVKELRLIKFSDSILLSPIETADKTREYLTFWKIKFEDMPVLMAARLF